MIRVFVCVISVPDAAARRDYIEKSMPRIRRERYDSALSEAQKSQFLAAQAALDGALTALLPDYEPPARFSYLPDGRPWVEGACVSISHTDAMAVCAAAPVPVGADVEFSGRKIRPEMARRVLSSGEENPRGLLGAWVDKEAYLKFTGEGISGGMQKYRAGESEIFDETGARRAFIKRLEIDGHLLSVCCGEEFEICLI